MKIRVSEDGGFTLLLESAKEAMWLSERALEVAEHDFRDMQPGGFVALMLSDCEEFDWADYGMPGLFGDVDDDEEAN